LSYYGQSEIVTPRIDRMAQDGMRFTQFYSDATVCAPLRRGLMNCKLHVHTRVLRRYLRRVVLRNGEAPTGPSTEAAIPVKVEVP
jgi:arylsulfatase A-like enzyme